MIPSRSHRPLAVILASISAIAVTAALSFASPAMAGQTNELNYSVDAGQVTISGCNESCPSVLVIPDTIDGNPVVAIGVDAFANQEGITSITIPEGVTSIGEDAFGGANGITSVTIPSTVTSLGRAAFQSMNALTTVTFAAGSKLATISSDCFRSDGQLKNVVLPASVTSIEQAAFRDDDQLTSITFQGDAPTIGDEAFTYVGTGAGGGALAQLATKSLKGYGLNGDDFYGLTVAGGYSRPGTPGSFSAEATLVSNPVTTTVNFTLAETGGTVECRVNDGAWGDCTSVDGTAGKFTVSNLTGGGKSISVRQTNGEGIPSEVGTVYLAPTLIDAPVGLTTKSGFQFKVEHASNGELWCKVNTPASSVDFRPCANISPAFRSQLRWSMTSGESVDGVTTDTITTCSPTCFYIDGTNELSYKQVINGIDSLVSQVSWTQDTTGPDQPTLTGKPEAFTKSTSASISFTSEETDVTFKCSVDDEDFAACTSPKSLSGLADGPHSMAVRGVDSLGNVGYESNASWTVDTQAPAAPTVTSPANSSTSGATAPFTAGGEEGAKLLCSLDSGDFVKCPRASSAPGDKTTITVGWNTKLHWGESAGWSKLKWGLISPPDVSWRGDLASTYFRDGVTPAAIWAIVYGGYLGSSCEINQQALGWYKLVVGVHQEVEDPAVFSSFDVDCSDPSTGEVPPGSPAQFTELSEGSHTLAVKQVDKAGNESAVTTRSWFVDSTPPAKPVIKGISPLPSASTAIRLTFGRELGANVRCSLDGAAEVDCTSGLNASRLAKGSHRVIAIAIDAVGNRSAPATAIWTIYAPVPPPVTPTAAVKVDLSRSGWTTKMGAVFGSGSGRTKSEDLTSVQFSTSVAKPNNKQSIPAKPTFANMIMTYKSTIKLPFKKCPTWVRVGNRVGNWSGWVQVIFVR